MTASRSRSMTASRTLRRGVAGALLGAALASCAGTALALTDEEVYRQLRFNVTPPGARAMGLGGAVIGQADDPGAIFSNPGGIAFFDRPQVFMEYRGSNWDDTVDDRIGSFHLNGDRMAAETLGAGSILYEEDGVSSLGFIGYVHPVNEWFSIGVSRHEWLNFERDVFESYTSTAFPPFEGSLPGVSREGSSSVSSLDALMDVFSVSLGWAPVEQVSVGLSLSAARLDVVQTVDTFTNTMLDVDNDGTLDTFLRPIDYRTLVDDDDLQFTFTAGILWRPMETIGIGVVYRDGPEFEVIEQVMDDGVSAKSLRENLFARGIGNTSGEFVNTWAIPDSYGVGFSFGPYLEPRGGGGLVINVDAVHVEYADLLDGYVGGLNSQLFATASAGSNVVVEDQTEFHVGIGYTWTVGYNNSIHVRFGAYSDPDHSLITSGRGAGVGASAGRDDIVHGTAGAGFTLKRGFYSFELDAAADVSEVGEQFFGSALFKF